MTDGAIRALCIADTIHDFGADLKDNQYYKFFMTKNRQTFYDLLAKEPLNCTYSVEKDILDMFRIDDENINVPFKDKDAVHIGPKLFAFVINDVTDNNFKQFLGAVTATGTAVAGEKFGNIHFLTDTNKLSNSTLCSLEYLNRNGQLIICEATDFDRGLILKEDECVHRHKIDVTLPRNNLFGLDSIRTFTDRTTHLRHIEYSFTENGVQNNTLLNTSNFILEQRSLTERNLNFYKNVIATIDSKSSIAQKGGAGKRKSSDIDDENQMNSSRKKRDKKLSLDTLLNDILRVYGLDYRLFNFYVNKKIIPANAEKFISILFDFKRAGDQLQVLAAKQDNNIFISNDRMSLTYAYLNNMPCIKTTVKQSSTGSKHSDRKLTFYNFNQSVVIEDVIDGKGFYLEIIAKNIKYIKSYIEYIKRIPLITDMNKIRASLQKSMDILNLNDIYRSDPRNTGTFDQQPPVFIYKYIHIYNVLLHLILINIRLHIDDLQQIEANLMRLEQEFERAKANPNITVLKQLADVGKDVNQFARFVDLSETDNFTLIMDLANLYNGSIPEIMYDSNTVAFEDISTLNKSEEKALMKSNKDNFYNHLNSISSIFVKYSKIPILKELYEFNKSWYKTHSLLPSGQPNIRFFKDGKTAEIYLDNDFVLVRIKNDASDIKSLLSECEELIDNLARNIDINLSRLKIYRGGRDNSLATKPPLLQNILNKFINLTGPQAPTNKKSIKDNPSKKSISIVKKHITSPFNFFVSRLNKIYGENTNEDQMSKFLIIFMLKAFNIFNDKGYVSRQYSDMLLSSETSKRSIAKLSTISEETSSKKYSSE
jgi:hypothetical protein